MRYRPQYRHHGGGGLDEESMSTSVVVFSNLLFLSKSKDLLILSKFCLSILKFKQIFA
jgi:hypothetical protein